eukprot:TRINITY_DN29289_c0_g1_i1.p1 TRINITY_DN29289_c0_g1~~TRINITY_DN29289_c0_g1_i1.p1  ORF type:complete len:237 (+),score=33.42 TRINITY_DN29289_c0_g1_i1:209-919(+)
MGDDMHSRDGENGVVSQTDGDLENEPCLSEKRQWSYPEDEEGWQNEGLIPVLKRMMTDIIYPSEMAPLIARTKKAFAKNVPLIKLAAKRSSDDLIRWTRSGSAWRALLVISVGTILLLALTGLGAFMLFFLAATTNAIIVSLLMSLAAVGTFMALFFTCVTAVYVSALSIAAFAISVATLVTMSAVAVAAGWIGFFWLLWQAIQKAGYTARNSFMFTASALAAISTSGSHLHSKIK